MHHQFTDRSPPPTLRSPLGLRFALVETEIIYNRCEKAFVGRKLLLIVKIISFSRVWLRVTVVLNIHGAKQELLKFPKEKPLSFQRICGPKKNYVNQKIPQAARVINSNGKVPKNNCLADASWLGLSSVLSFETSDHAKFK